MMSKLKEKKFNKSSKKTIKKNQKQPDTKTINKKKYFFKKIKNTRKLLTNIKQQY